MAVGRSFGLKQLMTRNFLNLQDKIADILMLTCEVPGEGFIDLEETDVQEVPNCYSAE